MNDIITSINYPFGIDSTLGVWLEQKDFGLHVQQMMMQVLFTNPGERVNRPDFGCGIRNMVFAPNSDTAANLMQALVAHSLDKWLGNLIDVNQVAVVSYDSTMEVQITYTLKSQQQQQYLNVQV